MTGYYAADVSQLTSVAEWKALMALDTPVSMAQVRCYQSTGAVDQNAVASLTNAREAGIETRSAYHFPTTQVGAAEQASASIQHLAAGGVTIDRYWIDVEWNPALNAAHWSSTDKPSNVAFVRDLVQACSEQLQSHPQLGCQTIGIYTRAGDWNSVTAGASGFGHLPLWWIYLSANPATRNGPNSFNQFSQFVDWTEAFMVQFNQDLATAGASYDLSWAPALSTAVASVAPATPTPPAQPSSTPYPTPSRPFSYTVEPGDTFESLLTKFGVDRVALANANNIINPADVTPGRVLTIP